MELAEKLKELGVPQDSFFLWYSGTEPDTLWRVDAFEQHPTTDWALTHSAFTVAELGEMLPRHLQLNGFSFELSIFRSSVWRFYYGGPGNPNGIFLTAGNDDTEADARAAMLIYLIENNLLDALNVRSANAA